MKTKNRSIIILLVNSSGYGRRGRAFGPARELLTNEGDSILLAYSGFREGRAIPLRNRDYELRRYLTIRCIFCGRKLTKHDTTMLSNTDKLSAVLSLQDKVLFRTDRRLSTYIAHAEETQPTLSLGNGWHAVSCFSGTEFKQPRIRTIGILNNKIYWDDFPHSKEDPRGQMLKVSWINHLMGIVPAERQPIDAKTRALVLETTDGTLLSTQEAFGTFRRTVLTSPDLLTADAKRLVEEVQRNLEQVMQGAMTSSQVAILPNLDTLGLYDGS